MYLAINPLLKLFLNDYMKGKFPNSAKNVDNFPNLMGQRPCTKKDCDSPEHSLTMFTLTV